MPGPGGGSRGGGFGRSGGGSFGSGSGGFGRGSGGFGRGPRPGRFGGFYRPHFHMPFFGFPRPFFGYGYGGGGCLGGLMGIILFPVLIISIVASVIFSIFGSFGGSVSNIASGGHYIENDEKMKNYCMEQYAKEFSDTVEYEDNILIVFLVDDNRKDFYTKVYVGDNIEDSINDMFGGMYTEYGRSLMNNIQKNYDDSLSRTLAATVRDMTNEINDLSLESSFYEEKGSPGEYISHVTSHSSIEINENTINSALKDFTEETDIPIVIVIDDMDEVLDKRINGQDILNVILAIAIGGLGIYFIVRAVKGQKTVKDDQSDENDEFRKGWGR
jgi:hypothetical protein